MAIIDIYPKPDSDIELWVQSESFYFSDLSDESKRCYTGGRNGVMSLTTCNGVGTRFIVVAASDAGEWSFYEIFAWENEHLEADVATLAFTGMTPDHSGGQTLFGVSDPENTALTMALDGTEHKLSFDLLAEDVVLYIFFAAKSSAG